MRRPTYRVQLHGSFGFEAAAAITDYLDRLGVGDLYCSPILEAAPGSTHGYDVVDPSRLDEARGGAAGFAQLSTALSEHGMGLLADIVPNHMAADAAANPWWRDVLENGPASRYAPYFDIDWDAGHQVLVPVLAEHYGRVLDRGEITLCRRGGVVTVRYQEHELPLSPRTLDTLLEAAAAASGSEELARLAAQAAEIPSARLTDRRAVEERHQRKEDLLEALGLLLSSDPEAEAAFDAALEGLNRDPDALDALLLRQNYRLSYWRAASEQLDYRRFFTIPSLVGMRVEDEEVFRDSHELILRLVGRGQVSGLRVDHVDGLRDPEGYLRRLRRAAGDVPILVEKILSPGEDLPSSWPVEGTTGYDFLADLNALFVDPAAEEAMTACYARLTGESDAYGEVAHRAKHEVMAEELAAEVQRLGGRLAAICEHYRHHRDRTRRELTEALGEMLACFPVYRSYGQPDRPLRIADKAVIAAARAEAERRRPDIDPDLLSFMAELLSLSWPGGIETDFALAFSQVSSPVMAKGVEDTAFYRYNRLVSLNEVGCDPGVFGLELPAFHERCAARGARWPQAMLSLSTHDSKRSADVRARISLLSEMPIAWEKAATALLELGERHAGGAGPDLNTAYLYIQTLIGVWPASQERISGYMAKAAKEAKVHTSWERPSADYDADLESYVSGTLADERFVAELEGFLERQRVVELGRMASLSQLALLLTCPGVPDLYQGAEVWDNRLVDPDNRGPVDYEALSGLLGELENAGSRGDERAWALSDRGGPKLWMASRLLGHRRRFPELYASGRYEPLEPRGPKAPNAVAFAREGLLVVATRLPLGVAGGWGPTRLEVPPGEWSDVLSGARHSGGEVEVAELLGRWPVAVLARADG